MRRKRFGNIPVGTFFLWDKKQKSLHIKIDSERAVILDDKSNYKQGAITVMSDYCLVEITSLKGLENNG